MEVKGPGKTAPRLILDLLEYDPRYPRSQIKNLLVNPAPVFRNVEIPRTTSKSCRHDLKRKDTTEGPESADVHPNQQTKYTINSFCAKCRHHYTITIDFTRGMVGQIPCRLSNAANPLHHLRHVSSKDPKTTHAVGASKYSRFLEEHYFKCSGKYCPLIVGIKILSPRINTDLLSLITDSVKIRERGTRCIQADPIRFENMGPASVLQVLNNLRTYIADAKVAARSDEQPRKIQARNKMFVLSFSDDCDALLEHLDFAKVQEPNPEPPPAEPLVTYWRSPVVNVTNREFIVDCLHEIECLMADRPPEEQNPKYRLVSQPVPAMRDIERSLGYQGYPMKSRTIDLTVAPHPYYASLGALDNFTDDLLGWAYDRQGECDPANKPYYLDCLKDLAKGRHSSDLDVKVIMAESAGDVGLATIEGAYNHLGIDPNTTEGDDYIINVYQSRIQSAPKQKSNAKNALSMIGKARGSTKIEAVANDNNMTLDEALELLDVPADTDSDSIEAVAIALSSETEKSQVARALRVIANHRPYDFTLQRAAAYMETGTRDTTLAIGEAYRRLEIKEPHIPDETVFSYYRSLCEGAAAGSRDSYIEALRVIASERQSHYLSVKLDDPNADVQADFATADQPIGLGNIGNTCYLNSLLQYFYTVKGFRDLVMEFPRYRMSLEGTDVSKLGGRVITKAEIERAQRFVEQLRLLFEQLKTAVTRSIKPTRGLVELTLVSRDEDPERRNESTCKPAGPSNTMSIDIAMSGSVEPSPSDATKSTLSMDGDTEMMDNSTDRVTDGLDVDSDATLVDSEQPPRPHSNFTIHATTPSKSPTFLTDNTEETMNTDEPNNVASMTNGIGVAVDTEAWDHGRETRPPVPSRNKSGLSVKGYSGEDQSNGVDAVLKFGVQHDVTEVIGRVLNQVQWAIRPTGFDRYGNQIDEISDLLYGVNAETKRERIETPWSYLTAFPDERNVRDIYEALDVTFDEQMVETEGEWKPSTTSIVQLPPVLQIHLMRTMFDKERGAQVKNSTPVSFPETLYLDRYMDGDHDSPLMRRRREAWNWKKELATLETRFQVLRSRHDGNIDVQSALDITKQLVDALESNEDYGIVVHPSISPTIDKRLEELERELMALNQRMGILRSRINEQFTDMTIYKYTLHSVFMHRGQDTSGGHYWIYIYDFENDLWREYNDESVTIIKDRKRIFESNGFTDGTPYYLTYVKSEDRKDLVNAACRDIRDQACERQHPKPRLAPKSWDPNGVGPTSAWNQDMTKDNSDINGNSW